MNMIKIIILILIGLLSLSQPANADKNMITGTWKTIDDETRKVRSLVELTIKDNKLYGIITKLFPNEGEADDPLCDKCSNEKKDQPILGLQIIDGLTLKKNEWKDGQILDPNNGKTYDCKIWLENGKLQVRGYIGFFFRTQEWIRG